MCWRSSYPTRLGRAVSIVGIRDSLCTAGATGLTDEELLGALGGIPVLFQEVIVLCDVEELTYKEIADALSIPLGTVMSRLHRGRALLRSELVHRGQSIVSGPKSETTRGMPRRS